MTKYRLANCGVFDQERNCHIPDCDDNVDWMEYQAWLADGNTPDENTDPEEI